MPAKKILVIDDDARNVFALNLVLKSKGYTLVSASDGPTGIRMAEQDADIALVLLDMMMPEMDGYEVISIIRSKPAIAKLPLIAVTAQAMAGDREKCLEAGADDYISKPVNVDQLIVILDKYL
ncbi:response regulator [Mucilaginibacter limnophilus]|uniref:Response regulator n=1 Tax=Mucilaginibacter limnophilus TaxID=1932778 RepID=A0A437MRV2_9SPHI|nr:response regulator [Mucilaginibacter limnophilus]RVU00367.1 response regulator [Mucilaginibacter limnophilus]